LPELAFDRCEQKVYKILFVIRPEATANPDSTPTKSGEWFDRSEADFRS